MSSVKCTPPVLRICVGALCPRKNTDSGKSFALMSAAFSTVSVLGVGSADCARSVLVAPARKTANRIALAANFAPLFLIFIETPSDNFSGCKDYLISLLNSDFLSNSESRAFLKIPLLVLLYAVVITGGGQNASTARIYEGIFSGGAGRNSSAGRSVGASAGQTRNHSGHD